MMNDYYMVLKQITETSEIRLNALFGFGIFSAVLFFVVLMACIFSRSKNKDAKVWMQE
jgi:hypothetical protein